MDTVTLTVEIPKDHHLELDLPEDLPVGQAEVTIKPYAHVVQAHSMNHAREVARAKLMAAGALNTSVRAPEGTILLSPEELLRLGTLPSGSPTLLDLVDEDRGPR